MTAAAAYLATARKLLEGEPAEIDIRRAVSTAYYALFHHICFHFGGIVMQPKTGTYQRAQLQAYRYMEHALTLIASAEDAIAAFDAGPIEAQRAFVLFLGLRPKNR